MASRRSTMIDDLPDFDLVEILCRLPNSKLVHRCKCISKRWLTLLSDPYFIRRYLQIKHDRQVPLLNHYVMIPPKFSYRRVLIFTPSSSAEPTYLSSSQGVNTSSIHHFLPCFKACFKGHEADTLKVSATYNDLFLCSQPDIAPRIYYICNPYNKDQIRLPPTPQLYPGISINPGFVCDPYYKSHAHVITGNRDIKLNPNYRFRIARLLPNQNNTEFGVAIFTSETREWREYLSSSILCQQRPCVFRSQSVACFGKLYWLTRSGRVLELDPFSVCSTTHVIHKCGFIDLPFENLSSSDLSIGVCRGRLRMCSRSVHNGLGVVIVWELKQKKARGKSEWRSVRLAVSQSELVLKQPYIRIESIGLVGFHPVNKDIVYLKHTHGIDKQRFILACDFREKTLEIVGEIPFENNKDGVWHAESICRYAIQWWPTPIEARLNYGEEYFNVIVQGRCTVHVEVSNLSSVAQLRRRLQIGRLYFHGLALHDDMLLTEYGIKDKSVIVQY